MEQCPEPAEKLGARGPGHWGAGTAGGKRSFAEGGVAGSLARFSRWFLHGKAQREGCFLFRISHCTCRLCQLVLLRGELCQPTQKAGFALGEMRGRCPPLPIAQAPGVELGRAAGAEPSRSGVQVRNACEGKVRW